MKDIKRPNRRCSRRCTQVINYVPSEKDNTSKTEQKIREVKRNVDINNDIQDNLQSQLSSFQISLNFFKELERRNKEKENRYFDQQSKLKNNVERKIIEKQNNEVINSEIPTDIKEDECGNLSLKNSLSRVKDNDKSIITSFTEYVNKIYSFKIKALISSNINSNDIDLIIHTDRDMKYTGYIRDENIENIIDESFESSNEIININKSNDKIEIPERKFSFIALKRYFR